ncbi:hypothetical protein EM595_0248 [Duffyella gerundensis]|uniref:Uncharacterized protein n=1 Tax=Duffyella gerundensis TaxID=1619313 RepID=A0A0U5L016_9GAMM|nr:hypothetical protein EM595_0248 [Duffyella gerundensis]
MFSEEDRIFTLCCPASSNKPAVRKPSCVTDALNICERHLKILISHLT